MEEEIKNKRKKFSSAGKIIIIVSLSAAFIIAAVNIGVYTWAKYHSEDSGKGVATVSADFFFMSNLLGNVESIDWTYSYPTENEATDDYHKFEYVYGESNWDATTPCVYNLEIHNFENTLRYNAEDVEYALYVCLPNPPDTGDKYEFICYNDSMQETARYDLNSETMVTIENLTLEGDNASKDVFSLIVTPETAADFVPSSVIIYACITQPDYVDASQYYLGGIFSPQAAKLSYTATGKFDVEDEIDAGTDWLTALNDLSGYIYTVTTEGEADADHDIILYWNDGYINLDLHNSYYTEKTTLDDDNKYVNRIPIEYDGFIARGKVEDLPAEKQASGYTDYMVYNMPANRSSSFVFYKASGWLTENLPSGDETALAPASYSEFRRLARTVLY